MSADTAQKRYSAYDLGCPWRGVRVLPTGTVDAAERTAAFFLYAGITGVAGTAPAVTTTTLANGTQGTAYSATLAVTGDTPITWAVTAGSLPAGLTLSTGGVLSGTPTVSGLYSFTVEATNGYGSDTQALILTLVAAVAAVATASGGYWYDWSPRYRPRKRKQIEDEEQEIAQLPAIDGEIARILREQERLDDERNDRERLAVLAARYAGSKDVPERVAIAALQAQQKATEGALAALGREIERARDDEDIAALMVLLNQ